MVESNNLNQSRSSCCLLQPQLLHRISVFFGELLATALLMFLGCMGCIETPLYSNSHFQGSLNFGFVVLICIQCFGCVSGAHLNPAVTLACYVYKMISLSRALVYFVAQMLGAFIGYGLLKAALPTDVIFSEQTPSGVCVTAVSTGLTATQGLVIEFAVTSILIVVCCGVWDPRNAKFQDSVAIRFGLTVACISLTAGQFTGASMNPARSFAPAVWNGFWDNHWVYWVGPMSAALVTSLIYKHAFRREVEEQEPETILSTKPELSGVDVELP